MLNFKLSDVSGFRGRLVEQAELQTRHIHHRAHLRSGSLVATTASLARCQNAVLVLTYDLYSPKAPTTLTSTALAGKKTGPATTATVQFATLKILTLGRKRWLRNWPRKQRKTTRFELSKKLPRLKLPQTKPEQLQVRKAQTRYKSLRTATAMCTKANW